MKRPVSFVFDENGSRMINWGADMTDEQFFSVLAQSGVCLNKEQMTAVRTVYGPVSVFAGPGSGKTTVLVCRLAYMHLVCGISLKNCLVMTFTKAAAQEMKERLLGFPGMFERDVARMTIGTFHSVFYRFLLRGKQELPDIMTAQEQNQCIREAVRTVADDTTDEQIKLILTQIGLCKSYYILPQTLQVKKTENIKFKKMYAMYEALRLKANKMDYDDVLLYTLEWLRQDHTSRAFLSGQYPFLVVDEFQDTNFVQYKLLQMLAQEQNIFVVGDDDQAIYGFRGADVKFLLNFQSDFPNTTQIILGTNYRSTDSLIGHTSNLIGKNQIRQYKQLQGIGRNGGKLKLIRPASMKEEAQTIVDAIKKRINQGADAHQCAVLYRTHVQARSIVDVCIKENLPFFLHDDGNFYDIWYVRNVLQYLQAAANPNDIESLFDILNRPKRYVYGAHIRTELLRLCGQSKRHAVDVLPQIRPLEPYQIRKLEDLRSDIYTLQKLPPKAAIRYVLQSIGYFRYIEDYTGQVGQDSTEIASELEELMEMAEPFQTLQEFLVHITDARKTIAESVRNRTVGVQFMTFHRAKGLEFEDVYIVGAVEGMTPHPKAFQHSNGNTSDGNIHGRKIGKINDKEQEKYQQALEEERRLFYVACTRAKKHLYVSVPKQYLGKKSAPSMFVQELAEDEREARTVSNTS
ncbi:ATP-dependent helicase [Fodinisporobacter ferrooxydans]|uniref:DNA 3'-5' helicase n=1 Tax=Fodinisporobacter ferrooxydans TaxID=2901836 RepID=A0ABY4CPI4_9BACL|nr:ATP-dependent helicase [Alicyclobacillaceae bacterium MYW30-H2]